MPPPPPSFTVRVASRIPSRIIFSLLNSEKTIQRIWAILPNFFNNRKSAIRSHFFSSLFPDQRPENDVEVNEGKHDEYAADQAELTSPEFEEDQDTTIKLQKKFYHRFTTRSLCCFKEFRYELEGLYALHQSAEAIIIQVVNKKLFQST